MLFSVWHPALVDLRRQLGKPRHPVRIVVTQGGALPIEDGLLFNVPGIRVVIVATGTAAAALAGRSRSRPWITVIAGGDELDLHTVAAKLRGDLGIDRISAVGGRTTATGVLDARLVSDLYLTTSPIKTVSPARRGMPGHARRRGISSSANDPRPESCSNI